MEPISYIWYMLSFHPYYRMLPENAILLYKCELLWWLKLTHSDSVQLNTRSHLSKNTGTIRAINISRKRELSKFLNNNKKKHNTCCRMGTTSKTPWGSSFPQDTWTTLTITASKMQQKTYTYMFRVWIQGLTLARQALYHLSHSTSPVFVLGIFKTGFLKLSAWAGFKAQSSWSLPPE
jgi:hypothetical protein